MPNIIGKAPRQLFRERCPGFADKWYDMNIPMTAEEAWLHRNLHNPSGGRLPPNVANKAQSRMKRKKWVLCEDGCYRFLMPSKD